MSVADGTKRKRHVPVKGASHIYWSETKKGRVYEVRHARNADGKRLFEAVGTRLDQAKARAREVHGESAPRVASVGVTFAEVTADWQRTREMRPRSAASLDANLRIHILPRFGRKKVRDIDASMILAWLAGLERKDGRDGALASGTRRLLLATLQIVLQHAVEMGALSAVPRIPRRRMPARGESRRCILTPDEETRLLAYCAAFPWLAPIVVVALHQALRLGEVCALRWEDIDFVGNRLRVAHSLGRDGTVGPPKGGKVLTIPLTAAAREALLELRLDGGDGFIFTNTRGGPRQQRDVQRAFSKARDRAVLEDGVCFHSLRHTGISRAANHPVIPLVHVREFARHADLATTQGYVHRIEDSRVTVAFDEALTGGAA